MSSIEAEENLTKKDFATTNDVRWCPGCGDYAILNAVQRTMPELGIPKEKFVIVSGIGCSSRANTCRRPAHNAAVPAPSPLQI